MAYSPSHRTAHSDGHNPLPPLPSSPGEKQLRRMTMPVSATKSLDLPDDHRLQQRGRPPSPLRNGFIPDTSTGIAPHDGFSDDEDDEDDDDDEGSGGGWARNSHSPSSSVSQFAANLAQRVGTLVGNITPRSPGSMPTDAELEAEAERERDRSRREAERILTREAEERRLVEERVLAMMDSNRGSPKALPPPPTRSQSMPNPPSPANSQKDGPLSWWNAAKNRLTPTKEPLTPAQQIIQETKAREKEKKSTKGKEKEQTWPANTQGKFNDPAFLNLNIPVAPPKRRPVPSSPSSPTPSAPNLPPVLTPSPMRSTEPLPSSPSREPTPLYAQFNSQGTLDVHGTLLTVAKRFEKLEKWTVGHVRALEERMGDVERWLVEKEKEKEKDNKSFYGEDSNSRSVVEKEMHDIREDVVELQGRMGELGREVAKLATAPANLSSGPSRQSAQVSVAPQTTSSIVVHSGHAAQSIEMATTTTPHTRHARMPSSTTSENTSPPLSLSNSAIAARTRLPYPSGDYAAPGNRAEVSHSPTNSSPTSITSASRSQPAMITGLPGVGLGISQSTSYSSSSSSGLPNKTSPTGPVGLPPPKSFARGPSSVSPTPRKRYTVALGGPIVDPSTPPERSSDFQRPKTPVMRTSSSVGTAIFTTSPLDSGGDDEDEKASSFNGHGHVWNRNRSDDIQDDTIGKSTAATFMSKSASNANSVTNGTHVKPSPPRTRAQSTYGFSSLHQQPVAPTAPLQPRLRSHSTDRYGLDHSGSKFVDPLVVRRQDREGSKIAMPRPVGKVPIGQLVAFFDGNKGG